MKHQHQRRIIWLLTVVAMLLTGLHASAAERQIASIDFAFNPPEATIAVGDTVTWRNTGSFTHTTTRASAWNYVLAPGDVSPAVRFDQPGRFEYFCSIHPGMRGAIVVVGSSGSITYLPLVAKDE